jgi:hypothetical protein
MARDGVQQQLEQSYMRFAFNRAKMAKRRSMGVIIGVTGYLIKTPRSDFSEEKQ